MPRIAAGLIGLCAGYLLGAGLGAVGIALLSANTHDKSVEMAMTAIFVAGPLGALGLVAGLIRARKRG